MYEKRGDTVVLPSGMVVPMALALDLKATWDGDRKHAPVYQIPEHIPAGTPVCQNCGGPMGSGRLWAPTGKKRTRVGWFCGDKLTREILPYDCPICSSGKQKVFRIQTSGIHDYDSFDTNVWTGLGDRDNAMRVINTVLSNWTGLRAAAGWGNIVGGLGSGKTWMAQYMVYRLIEAGLDARYVVAGDLADRIYEAMKTGDSLDDLLFPWETTPILVIDELFLLRQTNKSGETDFALDKIVRMMDKRYRTRISLATVAVWDIAWWNVDRFSRDGEDHVRLTPNSSLAGNMSLILSRASEADWMAWTTIGDLRESRGMEKRGEL